MLPLLVPDWPLPANVKAIVTTRYGGVSDVPFETFNLGDHVGDSADSVASNRQALAASLVLEEQRIGWIRQVHGTRVVCLPEGVGAEADGAYTRERGMACAILTADCLPVLFCDRAGRQVAAAHAGWRGLLSGVLENTVRQFSDVRDVLVWLGPAIGPDAFEVGPEVQKAFVLSDPELMSAFVESAAHPEHFMADLYALARQVLMRAGVPRNQIFGGGLCTFSDPQRFYSYRRNGKTGRMASLIWLD